MASSDLLATWRRVKIGEIAKPIRRVVLVEAGNLYRTMGVKWWGLGAYERESKPGHAISATKMYAVKPGDLVINKIWVRHGSSAIVGNELDGCVVTADFPTFELDNRLILRKWLTHMFKTEWFWTECDAMSRGTSGRQRIDPRAYLEIEIPLPPLDEQRRIVARIEALAGRIAEAQGLQRTAINEAEALVSAYARKALAEIDAEITELRDWLSPDREGIQTGPFGAQLGAGDFRDEGVPILTIGNVQYGGLETSDLRHVSEEKARRLSRFIVQEGDILFARMGTVGRCCVVPQEAAGWLFNYHLIRVALDRNRIDPKFIHWTLRSSPDVEKHLSNTIRGATRQGVNSAIVGGLPCRVPSLPQQNYLVAYLDDLHARSR